MSYILQNANIYATNLKYMNDSEEYVNGVNELSKIINGQQSKCVISETMIQKHLKKIPDSYSISFSTARDLLSQWSMYAKESGISLRMEFASGQIYKIKEKGQDEHTNEIKCLNLKPQKVYYCTEKAMTKRDYNRVKKNIEKQLLNTKNNKIAIKDMESNAQEIWGKNIPYIKRYEFNAEEEYRLIFRQEDWNKKFKIEYRLDKNVLKPYVDVTCEGGWPINELIVGPGFNQQQVYESICHFLQNAELRVPDLSDFQFQKRCEKYLAQYLTAEYKIENIWKNNRKYLVGGKWNRYKQWTDIKKEMEMNGSGQFKKYLQESTISRDGIILTKSSIPYIF